MREDANISSRSSSLGVMSSLGFSPEKLCTQRQDNYTKCPNHDLA
jgi:hypothetical protein